MYSRETTTRRRAGKAYRSVRLVESRMVDGKVQQKTLLNLGAHFPIPKPQWPLLVDLIETLMAGSRPLFDPDPALEAQAAKIIQRLDRRHPEDENRTATVSLDSLTSEQDRSVGCERLALHALTELGFAEILDGLGVSPRDARIATALVMARIVHPASERETHRWMNTNSTVLELLDLDTGKEVTLDKLYRTCDLLYRHRTALEDALHARERTLLDTPGAVVFYDLTNTHMTGRPASELACFGHSKQKRTDCPLVTLALAIDDAGFPRRSAVLPGNVSEPGTLQDALDRLDAQDDARPTVVMDAGIATRANLGLLHGRGQHWITVRPGGAAPPGRDPDIVMETRAGYEARAWKLSDSDEEMELCIWSKARQDKDEAILGKKRERFEAELDKLHAGLSRRNCTKAWDKVQQRVGRLRERFAIVNRQYDITVTRGEDGNASAVTWARNAIHEDKDAEAGFYVLRTSHCDWDIETVIRTYWRLTDIEATFRSLKSDLGLRPIWHHKTSRIIAHLFIAVLAWHAVQLLRTRLAGHGRHDSWSMIRNKLGRWRRLTTTMTAVDGSRIAIRYDARPDPEACAIGRDAGVPFASNPHRIRARQKT